MTDAPLEIGQTWLPTKPGSGWRHVTGVQSRHPFGDRVFYRNASVRNSGLWDWQFRDWIRRFECVLKEEAVSTITPIPRDVLVMLQVELRDARKGTWELRPDANGVDVDFVQMLEEAITEIERLRADLGLHP